MEDGTWFGDVPYFDGVGFAIEFVDRIIRRHCGRFTRHRERERARDGEARGGDYVRRAGDGIQLMVVDRG